MSVVVVTFCNDEYLPLVPLWLKFLRASCATPIPTLFVALDGKARDELTKLVHGDHELVLLAPLPRDSRREYRARLWVHRMRTIAWLVDNGLTVIHSDLDAVWVGGMGTYQWLCEEPGDLVMSANDRGIPRRVRKQLGFNACCGLYRVGPKCQMLIRRWCDFVEKKIPDDQIAFNHLLLTFPLTGNSVDGWTGTTAEGERVHLLPLLAVTRRWEHARTTRIFHPTLRGPDAHIRAAQLRAAVDPKPS